MVRNEKLRAIGVGFSCVDVYEKLDKYYPTGNGVDWAVHLQRMGVQTSILSVVGTDIYGEKMKEALKKEGIDISYLHTKEGETCKMLMDLKDGVDRVHLEEIEGVMKDFALTKEDKDYICQYPYMHTDLFGNVLGDLEELHNAGVKVIMDFSAFSEDPEFCRDEYFSWVDYAFLSCEKEDDHVISHLQKIKSYGPRTVTATFGDKGSLCFDGERFYRHGIVETKVVNTVGAGDSYIAGFTYGIMNGWDIPACMKKGAEVSAGVVAKFEPY